MEQKLSSTQQLVWLYAGPPRLEVCEEDSFLCLYLDGILQSKMNQLAPASTLSAHLVPLLMDLQQRQPSSVLQLGLGGGDINRFITTVMPATLLVSVELEQAVAQAYQRFFCLRGKEQIAVMDAEQFLQQQQQQYELVFWDIYPLFAGWQQSMQNLLLQQKGPIWINLSQPEYRQHLEVVLHDRGFRCHTVEGYLNLLYQVNSAAEK